MGGGRGAVGGGWGEREAEVVARVVGRGWAGVMRGQAGVVGGEREEWHWWKGYRVVGLGLCRGEGWGE